ncbi:MAG: hypothetical protein UR89_C0034G0007 [Candidatus Roizmanbacteria bacterium GW2011_GWA2_35_8]|uniref:Uncharacterized protein n=1 Tax=Candidatus Roizmanbacteria bacterium GW2011_GWA2_35_8 TaxID=1618479 RepID=A0A0G0DBV4_9BACT|nr:MAG: hypothetical protein UR89_C0034G0007 [Candidatus Roizmanbacteria bacterium GW2011_GWA2_35_8]
MKGEKYTNNISLKDIGFLSLLMFGVAKTGIKGNFLHEKGHRWPKSGSFLLPILESVGKRKTPLELYPIVNLFYDYIRMTDDLFDKQRTLPTWENIKSNLKTVEEPLFKGIEKSKITNKSQQEYILQRINFLGESVYKTMEAKNLWTKTPSFDEAYSYRLNTSGLLSDVVADIWCIYAKVPDDLRVITREVLKRLGMVLQFRDDIVDLRQDGEMDGNLILALLKEENEKEFLFSSIEKSKKRINVIKLMKTFSPKSIKRVMDHMKKEFEFMQEQLPNVGSKLTNLIKFATYNNIFIKTE